MIDLLTQLATGLMSSLWIYPVIVATAAGDVFFPLVPSETVVITAGVFAAQGEPSLPGIIVAAAGGALVGDHASYLLGRSSGARRLDRMRPGSKRHRAVAWTRRALAERGGVVLVVARYIPGGRTAATLLMGAAGYPLRSFSPFAALAAVTWASYGALVGFVGGTAFADDPINGVLLGLGMVIALTVAVETLRQLNRRRAASKLRRAQADSRRDAYDGYVHRDTAA